MKILLALIAFLFMAHTVGGKSGFDEDPYIEQGKNYLNTKYINLIRRF